MQDTASTPLNRLDKKLHSLTHRPLFMFALFGSTSMTILGGVAVAAALPALERHFADVPHIDMLSKFILTLPALFMMIFAPLSGILLDKYGRLRFLIPAMIIWSISGMAAIVWDNIYWILCTRAVFGISTAFVMTAASALVADYYSGEDRQKALGLQGFGTACGSALFMSVGGVLAHFDWHYPFFVYSGGLLFALLVSLTLFEPRKPKFNAHTQQETSKFSLGALLPCYVFSFVLMLAYFTSPTQIPHHLIDNLKVSESLVGICISGAAFAYGISSLFYARYRARLSVRGIYIAGFLIMALGFACISFAPSALGVAFGLVVVGMGGGACIVNNSSYLLANASREHIAKAMGILSAMMYLGQFISPLLSQPIVRSFGAPMLFLIVAAVLCLLALMAFFILKDKK